MCEFSMSAYRLRHSLFDNATVLATVMKQQQRRLHQAVQFYWPLKWQKHATQQQSMTFREHVRFKEFFDLLLEFLHAPKR